jgi:hypothetical protein
MKKYLKVCVFWSAISSLLVTTQGFAAETNGERTWRIAQIDAVACEKGDLNKCYDAAKRFIYVDRNLALAMTYLNRVCDGEIESGCAQLGEMYHYGWNGVKKDRVKSLGFTKRACDLGNDFECKHVTEWFGGTKAIEATAPKKPALAALPVSNPASSMEMTAAQVANLKEDMMCLGHNIMRAQNARASNDTKEIQATGELRDSLEKVWSLDALRANLSAESKAKLRLELATQFKQAWDRDPQKRPEIYLVQHKVCFGEKFSRRAAGALVHYEDEQELNPDNAEAMKPKRAQPAPGKPRLPY